MANYYRITAYHKEKDISIIMTHTDILKRNGSSRQTLFAVALILSKYPMILNSLTETLND